MIESNAIPAPSWEPERLDPTPSGAGEARAPEDPAFLTRVLRVVGSLLLLAAASTFMLQRWQQGNDLGRYAMLLGHTALLTVAAYFCGVKVRESRGARTFLGLLLAVVPANFAVLGGLVYSQFRWDPVALQLPSHVTWVAPHPVAALGACAVTFLVLAPLCLIAFTTLARHQARLLTATFLVNNLAILLPVRNPDAIAILVGILAGAVLFLEITHCQSKGSLSTAEARFARAMPLLPLALMAGRCIHLYRPTLLLFGVIGLGLAYPLYRWSQRASRKYADELLLASSALSALFGWVGCATHFHATLHLAESVRLPLLILPGAALVFWYSLLSRRAGRVYRFLASMFAFGLASLNLLVYPEWISSLTLLVVGVALLAHGAAIRNHPALVSGAASLLFGLAYHVRYAIRFEGFAWVVLSVLGIGLIVGASYLERDRSRLLGYLRRVRGPREDGAELRADPRAQPHPEQGAGAC